MIYNAYYSQCGKFEGNLAEAGASRSCGGGYGSLFLFKKRPTTGVTLVRNSHLLLCGLLVAWLWTAQNSPTIGVKPWGVLGRNFSSGDLESKSAGIFIYTDKQRNKPLRGGGLNPLTPLGSATSLDPPWIRYISVNYNF